ncbi:MAG: LCP family protein [Oscillospiraceae bacterium]|nr:LCP family protein [Oscillospiraceae bacterium]
MSKKYSRVAMVFLKTLILTTVLLSGTVFILSFLIEKSDKKSTEKIVYEVVKEAKNPDNSLNMATLMILCENGKNSGTTFVIARFLSAEERVYLIPLPSDMVCQSGTETLTIYEFFRRYGCKKTLRAISETMNIQIEKYVFLDNTGFATAIDSISGEITYNISSPTKYYNETLSEYVYIEKGEKNLSGNEIRQYVSSPLFSEKFRSEQMAFILASAMEKKDGDIYGFSENAGLLKDFMEHNFSDEEFYSRAKCIKDIKERKEDFTSVILPKGEWKEEKFYLSVEFKNYLAEKLDTRKLAEISDGY